MRPNRDLTKKEIYFTKKQIELINEQCEKYGTTFTEQVRRVVDEYFEKKEKGE